MSAKFLNDSDVDDPILSVVNVIDIFLVIIAALLITIAQNPVLSALTQQNVTIITNPGEPNMEMVIKDGEQIERFKSSGDSGQGEGIKAGVAYRMKDGGVVYVPED